ncbi:unnamed protein product [Litomosoides sigmodontis]|uniref:Syndecan n=1 Tax=Litomosoides sigmodontis TaxID=42156 RepID=A0A3P6U8E9_LITSI|nr:unnamed protein product [Litomosoides sigmodontis]
MHERRKLSLTLNTLIGSLKSTANNPYIIDSSVQLDILSIKKRNNFCYIIRYIGLLISALIGGIVVGILASILLVMFVVYRMRKKDEGSYALDEPKQPPHYSYAYHKAPTKEFYA